MFVGRSKTSISVTVKHVQHVAILLVCSLAGADMLRFSVPKGIEKVAGL